MKKSIIALMGLFTLIACSEDSYQEADKMNETRTVNNGSEGNIKPMTTGPFYNSPYWDFANRAMNINLFMEYTNSTPLTLRLTPYGGDVHVQTVTTFNPVASIIIIPPPFSSGSAGACDGIIPTLGGLCNTMASLTCDFGSPTANSFLRTNGKIHYFYYEIFNGSTPVAAGYLKQRFFNDGDLHSNITAMDSDWQYLSNVPGLPAMYDAVAMYSVSQDEICIAQDGGMTSILPSSVQFTDPSTGIMYTLEYYTNGPNGNPNGVFVTLQ